MRCQVKKIEISGAEIASCRVISKRVGKAMRRIYLVEQLAYEPIVKTQPDVVNGVRVALGEKII